MKQEDKVPTSATLRLSCVHAFISRVQANVRLIKITAVEAKILITVVLEDSPSQEQLESIQDASTEVIADFPGCNISEDIKISQDDIPFENVVEQGWIFRRHE